MNHIHRIVWNAYRGTWVVTSEGARSQGKSSTTRAGARASVWLLGLSLAAGALAQSAVLAPTALPTAGRVSAGNASMVQSGAVLNVNQTSQRGIIEWGTFNVGSAAQVNFQQPNAQAVTLNRVADSNASQIQGRINATGQVWLLNPNGVWFGKTANVDVGGLVATTHNISDANFMAGGSTFSEPGSRAAVVNQGTLQARLSGYIALLAPEVRNEGVIVVPLGTAALASGASITLHLNGTGLTAITATPSQLAALVENKNAIIADEGMVILSARAVDSLLGGVVKNSGRIAATGIVHTGGRILLEGDAITLAAGSALDASGATGGGTVLVGGDWQGSGRSCNSRLC